MHNVLHPRNGGDRLYVTRNEWGRELTSNEDRIDPSIQWFDDNIEKCRGRLIQPPEAILTTREWAEWI